MQKSGSWGREPKGFTWMAPGLGTSEGRDVHPNLERGMEKESDEEAAGVWRSKRVRVGNKHGQVHEAGARVGGTGGQPAHLPRLAKALSSAWLMEGELQYDKGSQYGARGQAQSRRTPLVLRKVPGTVDPG